MQFSKHNHDHFFPEMKTYLGTHTKEYKYTNIKEPVLTELFL